MCVHTVATASHKAAPIPDSKVEKEVEPEVEVEVEARAEVRMASAQTNLMEAITRERSRVREEGTYYVSDRQRNHK
jgi:hypothetical protein